MCSNLFLPRSNSAVASPRATPSALLASFPSSHSPLRGLGYEMSTDPGPVLRCKWHALAHACPELHEQEPEASLEPLVPEIAGGFFFIHPTSARLATPLDGETGNCLAFPASPSDRDQVSHSKKLTELSTYTNQWWAIGRCAGCLLSAEWFSGLKWH